MTMIGNCFDDMDFDVTVLESSCVADMVIGDESSDHIEYMVPLRWSDCDCSDLWKYFGWDNEFECCRIGDRMTAFGVERRSGGTEIEVRALAERIVGRGG